MGLRVEGLGWSLRYVAKCARRQKELPSKERMDKKKKNYSNTTTYLAQLPLFLAYIT